MRSASGVVYPDQFPSVNDAWAEAVRQGLTPFTLQMRQPYEHGCGLVTFQVQSTETHGPGCFNHPRFFAEVVEPQYLTGAEPEAVRDEAGHIVGSVRFTFDRAWCAALDGGGDVAGFESYLDAVGALKHAAAIFTASRAARREVRP